jgi:hypothetical protein
VLSLDSPRWSELRHAYGPASNIPALLRALQALPAQSGDTEPWFTLWSALAHQGDVYDATFAAVPHVVEAMARDPLKADSPYLQFPSWVEICRAKNGAQVPEDLQSAYFSALARLPILVAAASARQWDEGFLRCALAALAVAKGQPIVGEASLELTPEVAQQFMEWFYEQ